LRQPWNRIARKNPKTPPGATPVPPLRDSGIRSCDHESQPDSWKPIVECAVEERTEAAKHVCELKERILAAGEQSITAVSNATELLKKAFE
jgi:hypothetical protein